MTGDKLLSFFYAKKLSPKASVLLFDWENGSVTKGAHLCHSCWVALPEGWKEAAGHLGTGWLPLLIPPGGQASGPSPSLAHPGEFLLQHLPPPHAPTLQCLLDDNEDHLSPLVRLILWSLIKGRFSHHFPTTFELCRPKSLDGMVSHSELLEALSLGCSLLYMYLTTRSHPKGSS